MKKSDLRQLIKEELINEAKSPSEKLDGIIEVLEAKKELDNGKDHYANITVEWRGAFNEKFTASVKALKEFSKALKKYK